MADEQRKKSRGWSWGMLGLSVLVFLLISMLIGFNWYHSTADLDAIREQAKAQGMPVTWEEMGQTLAASEDIERFDRLAILSKGLKEYKSELSMGKIEGDKEADRLSAFLPIPDKAVQFHNQLDLATVTEALAIIDQLSHGPLLVRIGGSQKGPNTAIENYRQVARWMNERVLLADEHSVDEEAVRLLQYVSSCGVTIEIDYAIKISLVQIVMTNVTSRIISRKGKKDIYITLLNNLLQQMEKDSVVCYEGGFIEFLETVAQPSDIGKTFFNYNWYDFYYNPLKARVGRYAALEAILSGRMMAMNSLSLAERVRWARDLRAHKLTLRDWHPNEWLEKMVSSTHSYISVMHIRTVIQLQVVLAELRQEPWPNDPFDPAGGPLHRIERDGKLMGVYSLGENGIDDGGDKRKDYYFPLYGPLEPSSVIIP